jgi:uncharacterized protein YecE (DUF72 family)
MRLRSSVFAAVFIGVLSCCQGVRAQQTGTAPVAVIPADQQIMALFQRISQHPARLLPLLEQVRASEWIAKGAPETYTTQVSAAREQIRAIGEDRSALAQHPDRMQDCMRALFRVQAFHGSLNSLIGGLRRYQNPALADLIQSVAVEDQEDLGKLQEYILELANQKEQEYLVVDHEAQRCRATLSKDSSTPGKAVRRANP